MLRVEVYEWNKKGPRPGATHRASDSIVDVLEVPDPSHLPAVGDVLLLPHAELSETHLPNVPISELTRKFRVVSREFLFNYKRNADALPFEKVWIHVEPMSAKDYERRTPNLSEGLESELEPSPPVAVSTPQTPPMAPAIRPSDVQIAKQTRRGEAQDPRVNRKRPMGRGR